MTNTPGPEAIEKELESLMARMRHDLREENFLPGEDTHSVTRIIVVDNQGNFYASGHIANFDSGLCAIWALIRLVWRVAGEVKDHPGQKVFQRLLAFVEDELPDNIVDSLYATPEETYTRDESQN